MLVNILIWIVIVAVVALLGWLAALAVNLGSS
jgi:hypothetical protein